METKPRPASSATAAAAAANMQQKLGQERHLHPTMTDESGVLKKALQQALDQSTDAPDTLRSINIWPLLRIVEDIFNRATPTTSVVDAVVAPGKELAQTEAFEDKTNEADVTELIDTLSFPIHKVATEIACNCTEGGDAHSRAVRSILETLSNYWWDAKLAILLSAFAGNYGEFWLLVQSCTSNQLAKDLAVLRQLPEILQHTNALKSRFDTIRNLIKTMLDITKCVVELKELPSHYITADVTEFSKALSEMPLAVRLAIRGILACSTLIVRLSELGREYISVTQDAFELSNLSHELTRMLSKLEAYLATCRKHIDEKKYIESYQNLWRLFEAIHIDNMKVLKALLNPKDDPYPLLDGINQRRVNIDVLRRKMVLLLISDLDIMPEEVSILEQIYTESRNHPSRIDSQYEVVWVPIVDTEATPWIESNQRQFESLKSTMTWYTLHHPSLIDRAVIKFIREKWHFHKKPILVVIDQQGRVACPNALHMMWIWGMLAFPFTTEREQILWKDEAWRLELLVDGIDPEILNWISQGSFICLYGGEDIDWIRRFTTTAKAVAEAAGISLKMVYVGKSNPKERVRRNIAAIKAEKMSNCLPEPDLTSIYYFWIRIESMFHSKIQLGKTVDTDPIMQEILTLLTFDGSSQGGWALLGRGATETTRAKGETFLNGLLQFNQWKENVLPEGFVQALSKYLLQIKSPHHCDKLQLPSTIGRLPETMACAECGRPMERHILYMCCNE